MNDEVIVWVDVESTGISPESSALLEVACLVTDTNLNVLDEDGFHRVVSYPAAYVDILKAQTDPFVVDMHNKTGLWDRLPAGDSLAKVDKELYKYITRFAPEKRQGLLGGNSITLDRNFLNRYLPKSADHLHYRSIDVTSIAKLAQWWFGEEVLYQKKYLHEAQSDILESINELRHYREVLFHLPVGLGIR